MEDHWAMGWVKERVGRHGRVTYTAMFRDLAGEERSAGTWSTEKRAIREWHKAEENIAAGRIGDPRQGRLKLRDYIESWLPNHQMEATTRENYIFAINKYILPELGDRRMAELMPVHVREWVTHLQTVRGVHPPTIRVTKAVLDAILTTALNERVTVFHAGRGVRTPPVARKPRRIISAEHYEKIHEALGDEMMQLLVETAVESGLRWGELTELRPQDIELDTSMLTVSRAVVSLSAADRPSRFLVKPYPKDKEWRRLALAPHLVEKLRQYIADREIAPNDLLFPMPPPTNVRYTRPAELPDPDTLGLTEPNDKGLRYRHGTMSAYQAGHCRCRRCKDVMAFYRAERRAAGKDSPRRPRAPRSDGHIPNSWFRANVWKPALEKAKLGFEVTPHGLRHAHASWLLAGGANLQVVKERLGHASITTTEQYLHTLPGADAAALAALTAIRGVKNLPGKESPSEDEPVVAAASSAGDGEDARDRELQELRSMVAKFRDLLGPISNAT